MRESSGIGTPWMYLVVIFASLALVFVVLPACNPPDESCSSSDPLCVEVVEMVSGVLVPTCALGAVAGSEAGCAHSHYHGAYSGFMGVAGNYTFAEDVADPAPDNCGQGSAAEVQNTQDSIEISQANSDAYVASVGSTCW